MFIPHVYHVTTDRRVEHVFSHRFVEVHRPLPPWDGVKFLRGVHLEAFAVFVHHVFGFFRAAYGSEQPEMTQIPRGLISGLLLFIVIKSDTW